MDPQQLSGQTVTMIAPDGSTGEIPAEMSRQALAAGGKMGIWMKAPDGSVGLVPHDRVTDAIKAKGTVINAPASAPNKDEGFWHSLGSVLGLTPEQLEASGKEQVEHPVKSFFKSAIPGIPGMIESLVSSAPNLIAKGGEEHQAALDAFKRKDYGAFAAHTLGAGGYMGNVALSPAFGEAPSKAGEQLGAGNVKGAAGTTAGILAPMVAGEAVRGTGTLADMAKGYTPSGPILRTAARTVLGNTVGRVPTLPSLAKAAGSNLLEAPTIQEFWQALKPNPQLNLFKNTPKLGDLPFSPETHPASAALLKAAAEESTEAGPSSIPRTASGDMVMNRALTALDKPTLIRVAKSRGIDTSAEANLIPSKAEAALVPKIANSMTEAELDNARDLGLELSRNRPIPGEDLGKKAMQEAWNYKVIKQFFPDVELPKALEARAQKTIAQRPDYTTVYQSTARKMAPAGATDAEVKATATHLQAQDQNMEALLQESIKQAQAKPGKVDLNAPKGERVIPPDVTAEASTAGRTVGLNERLSTVGLLNNPLLSGKPTISDLADAFDAYRKAQGLRPINAVASPERAIERATEVGKKEMAAQLKQPESGLDWYTKDITRTENAVQKVHPELADKTQMSLFKAMNAGTSLGNKSEAAITNALDVYDAYKKTGKVPLVNPETGKGWPNGQYNAYQNTFKTLQGLIDAKGEDAAAQWLTEKHPISEIRQFNKNVAGKAADQEYGALALGPKAGPFYLNMSGIKGKLTMDVWFTRTWNRWMGTMKEGGEMVEAPRSQAERDLMTKAIEQLGEHHGVDTMDAQAVLWNYEQRLYTKHGIPSEQPSYGTAAETVVSRRIRSGNAGQGRSSKE